MVVMMVETMPAISVVDIAVEPVGTVVVFMIVVIDEAVSAVDTVFEVVVVSVVSAVVVKYVEEILKVGDSVVLPDVIVAVDSNNSPRVVVV